MKKILTLLLAFVLVTALSCSAWATPGKSDKAHSSTSNGNASAQTELTGEETGEDEESVATNGRNKNKTNTQKEFKLQLNAEKKAVQQQRQALNQEMAQLEARYAELVAAGDVEGAALVQTEMNSLQVELQSLQNEMKQIINERYMVVKTMYTEEELAQFADARALIEQMYADAYALDAWSVTIGDDMIKFDTLPYIKGGVTMIPVRTITEELGATVTWQDATQSVLITKDNITVEMTVNSTTVYVDGQPVDLGAAAEVTCGRTYVPLRFLAETFGLDVDWDEENELIDLEEGTGEDEDAGEEEITGEDEGAEEEEITGEDEGAEEEEIAGEDEGAEEEASEDAGSETEA